MAFQPSTGSASVASSAGDDGTMGLSINDIPKTWNFTSKLPADRFFPTPADSHRMRRDHFFPRQVYQSLFTWVRPERVPCSEILAVSAAALRDLGIRADDPSKNPDFAATVAGNKLQGWDEEALEGPGYPWAQCYGGFQFGRWSGQLGDGRVISLFETTNPLTGVRYEVQLKGAGNTPYSRGADGKAVLRSSIREFIVSEALNALGIPTTRALCLSLTPGVQVQRDRAEPSAIVARFAQSWLRIGNFDILRARSHRVLLRRLANYLAEDVFGGWETLPGRLADPERPYWSPPPRRNIPPEVVEGPSGTAENRFARLYREIVRRNALTVAKWQVYGFMNGVLNTDNTSLLGLSMDFGPFAFMDNYDPMYTPNHDDDMLRYSYQNQPIIIWWNMIRLGEAFAGLIGSAGIVDDERFVKTGYKDEEIPGATARAEHIIANVGEEYRAVFLAEYQQLSMARLGLKNFKESDYDELFALLLQIMEDLELDFNLFFRRLSALKLSDLGTEQARQDKASVFFYRDGLTGFVSEEEGRRRIGEWLGEWRQRIIKHWGSAGATQLSEEQDAQRIKAMKQVNPNFIPRSCVLDEVVKRVEFGHEREVLRRLTHLAQHPFEDSWAGRTFDGQKYKGDKDEEARWTSGPPRSGRSMTCSCSS
ncbi:UPF0061-domain-containing protein [Camillea tinctor]|nr:UPF0061-domain-containing protein [Camillea tinctor]